MPPWWPAGLLLILASCGEGDHVGPSPAYYSLLQDAPCSTAGPVDTLMQPGGLPPNAGSGYIDSTSAIDRPPRAVLTVAGYSSITPSGPAGQLTFLLVRTPAP